MDGLLTVPGFVPAGMALRQHVGLHVQFLQLVMKLLEIQSLVSVKARTRHLSCVHPKSASKCDAVVCRCLPAKWQKPATGQSTGGPTWSLFFGRSLVTSAPELLSEANARPWTVSHQDLKNESVRVDLWPVAPGSRLSDGIEGGRLPLYQRLTACEHRECGAWRWLGLRDYMGRIGSSSFASCSAALSPSP